MDITIVLFSLFKIAAVGFLMKWALGAIFNLEIYQLIRKGILGFLNWITPNGWNFKHDSLKPYINIIVNIIIAFMFQMDFAAVLMGGENHVLSIFLTGLANGSVGSWFNDLFKYSSKMRELAVKKQETEITKPQRPDDGGEPV